MVRPQRRGATLPNIDSSDTGKSLNASKKAGTTWRYGKSHHFSLPSINFYRMIMLVTLPKMTEGGLG